MSPYSTRGRKASMNVQKSQLKSKTKVSAAKTESRNNLPNKIEKEESKVSNTRLVTRSKDASVKKQAGGSTDSVKSVTQEEKQEVIKGNRLRKDTRKVSIKTKSASKNESINAKRRKISKRTIKNVSLRQMSLRDSFLNQSRRQLRSQTSKHHKEGLVSKERDGPIRRSSTKKKKVPVYNCVSPEPSMKNGSEVYEFRIDINDPTERVPKKKRKATVKKTQVRKKKTNVLGKQNAQKTKVNKKEPSNVQSKETTNKNSIKPLQTKNVSVVTQTEGLPDRDLKVNLAEKVDPNKEATEVQLASPENVNREESKNENGIKKPTIVSVNDLSHKRIKISSNSPVVSSDDFKPFRPTNIFNNKSLVQQKNMLNYSLFNKSLSPIVKPSENYDFGSPWRAPPLLTFSQVKNVFQSTPQNKRLEISTKRLSRNESKNNGYTTKLKGITQKNDENVSMEGNISSNNPKNKSFTSSRKFGTEITNIDHSVQSNPVEEISERIVTEAENMQLNVLSFNTVNISINNVSVFDSNENKENSVLNYQSPKKIPRKGIMKVKSRSPQNTISNAWSNEQKENVKPLLGLSASPQKSVLTEQKENVKPRLGLSASPRKSVLTEQKENVKPRLGLSASPQKSVLTEQKENVKPRLGLSASPQKSVLTEQKKNVNPQLGPVGSPQKSILTVRNNERKENVHPQHRPVDSPQKALLNIHMYKKNENSNVQPGPSGTPQKITINLPSTELKENVDPQPGPSGLQNRKVFNENRVLRQSNLNNFLNIMDMPESTAITTPHGIFGDTHSTPVTSRPARKLKDHDIGVNNAFGFADEDSSEELSPVKSSPITGEKGQGKTSETNVKSFARLSVGEIKNKLVIKKPSENVRNEEKDAENVKKVVKSKSSPIKRRKMPQIDVASFSDTFDVLSETGEVSEVDTSEIPLFVDLEPTHFKQPPRHSYKRKRAVRFSYSGESSEDEEEALKHQLKRKRHGKLKKEDDKRLIEWIQNTNKTFDEIDQFDLLVE